MKCFPSTSVKTHMPFVFEHNEKHIFLFSFSPEIITTKWGVLLTEATYHPWSLGWSDWLDEEDGIHLIQTGFPKESVECNPVGFSLNGKIVITFIASMGPGLSYNIYRMEGQSMTSLSVPKMLIDIPLWSGYADKGGLILVPVTRDKIIVYSKVFSFPNKLRTILRAVPCEDKILLSGTHLQGEVKTILIDKMGKVEKEIKSNDAPVYKSHIYQGDIVQAIKNETGFEERELHWNPY